MKVTATQYAKTLYEATKEKSQGEVDKLVVNFVKIMVKNNQIKNSNRIINKFSEIWNKDKGILEAEVISREKLNSELIEKLNSFIKEKYKAEKVSIVSKIDISIKGGVIIRVGDEVMDGSIARQLEKLKSSLEE